MIEKSIIKIENTVMEINKHTSIGEKPFLWMIQL